MAILPRPARPSALLADFKAFLRGQQRHKLFFGLLAVLMPALIVLGFYIDADPGKQRPQIIYVQSYAPGRTDSEIMRQNIADQKIFDAKRRERQAEYRRLADRLGIE